MAGFASLFGEEAALGVARVMGSCMARLAETIWGHFELVTRTHKLNTGTSTRRGGGVLRRSRPRPAAVFPRSYGSGVPSTHLVNVSYQTWSTDTEQAAVTMERTICFADLVGSTDLLRAVSIRDMANMLRRFEEQVWDLVSAGGGRVVKLIGDEAMIVFEEPSRACRVGLIVSSTCQKEHPVRIGVAHGTVVSL